MATRGHSLVLCFIFYFVSCFKKHISSKNQRAIQLRREGLQTEGRGQNLETVMNRFPKHHQIRGFLEGKDLMLCRPPIAVTRNQELVLRFLSFDPWSLEAQFMMAVVTSRSHILCLGPSLHSCCFSLCFLHLKPPPMCLKKCFHVNDLIWVI